MKRKMKQGISQQEVSAALARFLKSGGIIKRLPDQNYQLAGTIGGDKYEMFESLSDLHRLAGSNEQVA